MKTKFDAGDYVFYLKEDKIVIEEIVGIRVTLSNEEYRFMPYTSVREPKRGIFYYFTDCYTPIREDHVFGTKDEILEFLSRDI